MGQQRLTVVQALPALESGGVERGTLEVNAELVRRGRRSIVISGGGRLAKQVTDAGGEHVEWPIGAKSPLTLRLVPRLRRLLRDEDAGILHARSRAPAWVCALAMRDGKVRARTRFVTTAHGVNSVSAYSKIMTRGERVIAVSEYVRQYLLKHYPGTDPGKIRVIHRGVDPAEFPFGHTPSREWVEAFHGAHPETRCRRLIALPGRITHWKGHADFIRIVGTLLARRLPVCGLIVGGEDPRRARFTREIHHAAETLGPGAIVFTGPRSDMPDVLAIADVVLSLSMDPPEAFGRVPVEALSVGTPVVGYDHGGVGETLGALLPEGRVAPGDVEGAAERVARFLESPPALRPNTVFTRQAMLDQTLALYDELAGA